jgi:hypothetical protein
LYSNEINFGLSFTLRIWMWRSWRPPTTWSARPRIATCGVRRLILASWILMCFSLMNFCICVVSPISFGFGVWSVGGGVAEIAAASSIAGSRADVAYCVHALARRLTKTRSWIVSILH